MLNLTDDQLEIRALRATEYELRDQVALLQKELFEARIEIQNVASQIYKIYRRIDEQVLSNERFAATA